MRRIALALVVLVGVALTPAAAFAQDEHSPIGDAITGHAHHVHTGNGGCVTQDAVLFEREARGLHHAATRSGSDRGPEHGHPCPS